MGATMLFRLLLMTSYQTYTLQDLPIFISYLNVTGKSSIFVCFLIYSARIVFLHVISSTLLSLPLSEHYTLGRTGHTACTLFSSGIMVGYCWQNYYDYQKCSLLYLYSLYRFSFQGWSCSHCLSSNSKRLRWKGQFNIYRRNMCTEICPKDSKLIAK